MFANLHQSHRVSIRSAILHGAFLPLLLLTPLKANGQHISEPFPFDTPIPRTTPIKNTTMDMFYDLNPWQPLSQLPGTIEAPMGQVTVYADFSNATDESITIYMVNNCEEDIRLFCHTGDFGLKLQTGLDEGLWLRAEPYYGSPTCATSNMNYTLAPSGFIKMRAPYYTEGIQGQIRYRMYNAYRTSGEKEKIPLLVSNAGPGYFLPQLIGESSRDFLSHKESDWDMAALKLILFYDIPELDQSSSTVQNIRYAALVAMQRYPAKQSYPILKKLYATPDSNSSVGFIDLLTQSYQRVSEQRSQETKGAKRVLLLLVAVILMGLGYSRFTHSRKKAAFGESDVLR